MPHIRLEFSNNLPAEIADRELLGDIHQILASHGVSIGNCKSRVDERRTFVVGDDTQDASFVHLDVSLLEGRTAETKALMGQALLERLVAAYAHATPAPQITVEVRDIRRGEYFKHPAGTI
jgi:5-carboxymethyl-2-hydroxymuconate isomerase